MRKLFLLIVSVIVSVNVNVASAQQAPAANEQGQGMTMPPVPADTAYRVGKLDNGLTYYIRHNEYPAHVANFYIAQRVGSIQEEDSQRGLAHFLEHMAFNGSTHFKGNGIIDFTRGLGVSFGGDLNAYTSIEQTVYRVCNVPTTRESALDSCLLILQDWSNGLDLDAKEIDKERGVVHGEWAMSNSAIQRLFERNLPKFYPNCRYGERLPIGTMEVVDNFKPKELRDYYHKWYYPENQAIIVIGDVDVDHIEKMIKQDFSGIKAGPNVGKVTPLPVPDNTEAIYVFDKDKEMQFSLFEVYMKSQAMPREMRSTMALYMQDYITSMITMMFNSRMSELAQQPDCPFVVLNLDYGDYLVSSTEDAVEGQVVAKEGKEKEAFATMIREIKRAKDFGFAGTELVRAKDEFMSQQEKAYSNRDKRKNQELYQQVADNFLDGDAMPDPDTEYQLWQMISKQLPLEMINQMASQMLTIDNDTNFVCYEFAQEKDAAIDSLQQIAMMKQIVNEVRAEKLTPWVDNVKDEPLVSEMPKAGTIKKETENTALGYKELHLSNGAKVILKKTDFKDDEVIMNGFAKGGNSLYGNTDYNNLKVFDDVIGTCGLGNFTNNELEKALAGKQASVSLSLGNRFANVSGKSTPKDMETMMQLLYLHFTALKKDEKAYNAFIQQMETILKNRDLQPEAQLSDSLMANIYGHNARYMSLTAKDLKDVDVDRILVMAKENYSSANNFTFTIIGNFDEAKARELVCQYIATLPGDGQELMTKDIRTYFKGDINCQFKRKMETPKPYIVQVYNAKADNAKYLEQNTLLDYTGEVLSMMLLKSVREDAGAAYSVGAGGNISYYPGDSKAILEVYAPISAPAKQDTALILIDEAVKNLSEGKAINASDAESLESMVNKVKENFLKNADINAKKNSYWQGIITNYLKDGIDEYTEYKKTVEAVTPAQVSAFLKNVILVSKNKLNVVMRPE